MNGLDWVSGAVVVAALCGGIIALATLGILDVARLYRTGEYPRPPTASKFVMIWILRRPVVPFLAGLIIGILAAHFGWYQCPGCP